MQLAIVRCGLFASTIAVLMGSVAVEAACGYADTSECAGFKCDEMMCEDSCTSSYCGVSCSGDACAGGCTGSNCAQSCSGKDCANGCTGELCGNSCSGEGCATPCSGEKCGAGCTSGGCASGCEGTSCGMYCTGDACAFGCTGELCGRDCSGKDCATNCIGKDCGELCTGEDCATNCLGDGCGNQVGDQVNYNYVYDDIHTDATATSGRKDFNLPCDQYALDWHCTYQTAETNTKGACLWDETNTICSSITTTSTTTTTTTSSTTTTTTTTTTPIISIPDDIGQGDDDVQVTAITSACVAGTCDQIDLVKTCAELLKNTPDAVCAPACDTATDCPGTGSRGRSRRGGAVDINLLVVQALSAQALDTSVGIPVVDNSGVVQTHPVTSRSTKVIALPAKITFDSLASSPKAYRAPAGWRTRPGCCRADTPVDQSERKVRRFALPSESYYADKKECLLACVDSTACIAFEVKRNVLIANHELETVKDDGHWWSNVKRITQNQCELFFAPAVIGSTSRRTNNCQKSICGSPNFGKKGKWMGIF